MIDLLLHMSEIYGQPNENGVQNVHQIHDEGEELVEDVEEEYRDHGYGDEDHLGSESTDPYVHNNGSLSNGVHSSGSRSGTKGAGLTMIGTTSEPASNVFDSMSSSVIKLTGGRALYLKEINRHLALICVLREEALSKQAIIDYNVRQLKESILKLFQLDRQNSPPSETLSNIIR